MLGISLFLDLKINPYIHASVVISDMNQNMPEDNA